jgi:hypothetical protein
MHVEVSQLRPLPDHVVAPLLRALMCIPRTGDALREGGPTPSGVMLGSQ